MNFSNLILFTLLITCPQVKASSAAGPPDCASLWAQLSRAWLNPTGSIPHFNPHIGVYEGRGPAILELTGQEEVYYLGSGVMGGIAYRVVPNRGAAYVLKIYDFAESAANDMQAFRTWRELSLDHLVRIPRHSLRESTSVMRLEFAAGQTVKSVLENSRIPTDVRARVRERYQELLQNFVDRASSRFHGAIIRREKGAESAFFAVTGENGQEVRLSLRPDNVVVDPLSLELTLIDPF